MGLTGSLLATSATGHDALLVSDRQLRGAVTADLDRLLDGAKTLVSQYAALIRVLADRLLVTRMMLADEIDEVVAGASRPKASSRLRNGATAEDGAEGTKADGVSGPG